MLEVAALTYGALASFVLSSASRNRKEARRNPPIVALAGWTLMAFSGATGAILFGYAGLNAAGVAIA